METIDSINEIKRLNQLNRDALMTLKARDQEIEELNQKLDLKDSEIASLKGKLSIQTDRSTIDPNLFVLPPINNSEQDKKIKMLSEELNKKIEQEEIRQSEVNYLNAKISEEKARFEKMVSEFETKIEDLKRESISSSKQLRSLKDDNLNAFDEFSRKEASYVKEIDRLERLIRSLSEEKNEELNYYKCKVEDLAIERQELINICESFKNSQHTKTIEHDLAQFKEKINSLEKTKVALETKLASRVGESNVNEAEVFSLRKENEKIKEIVRLQEDKIGSLTNANYYKERLEKEADFIKETSKQNQIISRLKLREKELIEQLQQGGRIGGLVDNKVELENSKLSEQVYTLKQENFTLISENTRLANKSALTTKMIEKLEFDLEKAKTNHSNAQVYYESERERFESKLNEMERYFGEEIDKLSGKLKNKEKDRATLEDQMLNLQNKFAVQQSIMAEKNENIKVVDREREELETKLSEGRKEANKLKVKINDLENDLHLKKLETSKLTNTLKDKEEYIANNIDSQKLEILNLTERLNLTKLENENLAESRKKLQNTLDHLGKETEDRVEEAKKLLRREMKNAEEMLLKDIRDLREENTNLVKENAQLKGKLNDMQESLIDSNALKNYKFLRGGDSEETAKLKRENESLKLMIDKFNNKPTYENPADKLTLEIEKIKHLNTIRQLEEENKTLRQDLNTIPMRDETGKSDRLFDDVMEKNKLINKLTEDLEATTKEHDDKVKELTKIIESQGREVTESKQKLFDLERKEMEVRHEIADFLEVVKKKDQEITALKEVIEDFTAEKQSMAENKDKKTVKLEKESKKTELKCVKLEQELNEVSFKANKRSSDCIENLKEVNIKFEESKLKFLTVMQIHENHVKFLKQRFNSAINDMIKVSALKKDSAEVQDKIKKMFASSADLYEQLAQRESSIISFKTELDKKTRLLKAAQDKQNSLQKEYNELVESKGKTAKVQKDDEEIERLLEENTRMRINQDSFESRILISESRNKGKRTGLLEGPVD